MSRKIVQPLSLINPNLARGFRLTRPSIIPLSLGEVRGPKPVGPFPVQSAPKRKPIQKQVGDPVALAHARRRGAYFPQFSQRNVTSGLIGTVRRPKTKHW